MGEPTTFSVKEFLLKFRGGMRLPFWVPFLNFVCGLFCFDVVVLFVLVCLLGCCFHGFFPSLLLLSILFCSLNFFEIIVIVVVVCSMLFVLVSVANLYPRVFVSCLFKGQLLLLLLVLHYYQQLSVIHQHFNFTLIYVVTKMTSILYLLLLKVKY